MQLVMILASPNICKSTTVKDYFVNGIALGISVLVLRHLFHKIFYFNLGLGFLVGTTTKHLFGKGFFATVTGTFMRRYI